MAKKPKLTPTFADVVTESPLSNQSTPVMTFPASRFVGTTQMALGNAYVTAAGQPNLPTPEIKPLREKVAIIGTAPSSRMLAPFQDMEWEIWGCSPGNMDTLPRVDVWFEIHKNLHWPECEAYGKNYIAWLSKQSFPVYMQDQSYFPHALTFPMRELVDRFGDHFFTSSFAWMMAFAIHKGFKEIGLFGVDMASKDEYILQRQAFFFWLAKARDLGIKITIPSESDLMQPPGLYGYSEVTPFGRKMHARKQELLGRIAQEEQQEIPKLKSMLAAKESQVTYLKGAVEDLEYILSIWPRAGISQG